MMILRSPSWRNIDQQQDLLRRTRQDLRTSTGRERTRGHLQVLCTSLLARLTADWDKMKAVSVRPYYRHQSVGSSSLHPPLHVCLSGSSSLYPVSYTASLSGSASLYPVSYTASLSGSSSLYPPLHPASAAPRHSTHNKI